MSLTTAQQSAFNTASGMSGGVSSSYGLFSMVLAAILLLWIAWLLLNTYRGYAERKISLGGAGAIYVRAMLLLLILFAFAAKLHA